VKWSLEILEPDMEGSETTAETRTRSVFKRIEGKSAPSGELMWDGRSGKGELAQSAVDYKYVFTAVDSLGNISTITGTIGVDVMVIREGNRFRIKIPSIVFPPNLAVFDGLNQYTLENNFRVIQRIAQVLNRYKGYKISVEGHANPTTAPGPERERERPELKALSEKRAAYVMERLIRSGVAANRLSSTGAGDTLPVVSFEDHANWWKNRRVDFVLIR
jgi:outer membrane protein OmpA-like peptidoglycan-associated protein